jgi:hypothetical protein
LPDKVELTTPKSDIVMSLPVSARRAQVVEA